MARNLVMTTAIIMGTISLSVSAQGVSVGESEYNNNCAACHGLSGRGDGPFSEFIKGGAPSLALLSKRNGGVFPVERVYAIIDGRGGLRGHGASEMPVWGQEYVAREVKEHGPFFGEFYSVESVRARILALIDHINTLQDK